MTFISSSIQCLNHINEKLGEINGDSLQKYERYQLPFHLFLCKCVKSSTITSHHKNINHLHHHHAK